jgi:Zn-dependent protease/CBS domain-containing protein
MSEVQGETVEQPRRAHSPWSLQVARVSGIPIRVHFTFLFLLVWIFLAGGRSTGVVLLVGLLFLCVVLHELGHALVAKRFGVMTKDITLYPIGGVAMLQGRPKPVQEFWIALAGPAVNVVIAILLFGLSFVVAGHAPAFSWIAPGASLIDALFTANLSLPAFNMVPAFPMDGGRVLRAALAFKLPEARATQIAGGIGQFLAILFGFVGLFYQNPIWMIIALFVYLGAAQEVQATVGLAFMEGKHVRDAMLTKYRVISSGASMEEAGQMLLAGFEHDFPVVAGEEVIGVLSRNDIARGLSMDGPSGYVAGQMSREFRRIAPDVPLESAFEMFNDGEAAPILVMDGERLVGMLTTENLSEFIMLEHAKSRQRHDHPR